MHLQYALIHLPHGWAMRYLKGGVAEKDDHEIPRIHTIAMDVDILTIAESTKFKFLLFRWTMIKIILAHRTIIIKYIQNYAVRRYRDKLFSVIRQLRAVILPSDEALRVRTT